jgi:anti-sigma28 factor (negative regulator of flagellin synthesis)
MASTKRSALAPGFTVDTMALHQYNTTNFVEYASFEQQAASNKRQAPSDSSNKQQASSSEQQASSDKPQAASSSILLPS